MSNWKWIVGLIKGNCAGCNESLYKLKDNGIVEYDSKRWHVHCVLDKLPEPIPPTPIHSWMGL